MDQGVVFLESIIKAIVELPEKIKITNTVDQMGTLFTLTVDPTDMGKVIGKAGATAQAIRTLLRVVGMRYGARINLKINEPVGGKKFSPTPVDLDDSLKDL